MNTRLKALAMAGKMDLHKVQALVDLHNGDERWVETILLGADTTQKAALASGVSYKAGGAAAPPATKAYNPQKDVFAQAIGADQVRDVRPIARKAVANPPSLKALIVAGLNSLGDLH